MPIKNDRSTRFDARARGRLDPLKPRFKREIIEHEEVEGGMTIMVEDARLV